MRDEEGKTGGIASAVSFLRPQPLEGSGERGRVIETHFPLAAPKPRTLPSFLRFGLLTYVESSCPVRCSLRTVCEEVSDPGEECPYPYHGQRWSVPSSYLEHSSVKWLPLPSKERFSVKFTEFKEPESTRSRCLRGQRET